MKLGIIIGTISILAFVTAIFFVAKAVQGNLTGNFVAEPKEEPAGEVVIKNGVQEVTLSYKKYPEGYKFNYYPELIKVKKDMPVRIMSDKSISGCYTSFNIPGLGIRHSFFKDKVLEFTPKKTGEFTFSCAMSMGGGTLVVK